MKGRLSYDLMTLAISPFFENPVSSSQGVMDVDLVYGEKGTSLNISNAVVYLPHLTITGGVQISRRDGDGTIALNLNTTPIPLPSMKDYLPVRVLPPGFSDVLKGITLSRGKVEVTQLKLAGGFQELKNPEHYKRPDSLYIRLGLKDAGFGYKGFKRAFSNVDGVVLWKGGVVMLQGVKGRYGGTLVEAMDGEIQDVFLSPGVRLRASATMDMAETLEEFKHRVKVMEKWQKVEGRVSLDLELTGKMKMPDRVSYRGKVRPKGLGLVHKDLPFPLKDITGEVEFDDNSLTLAKLTGLFGASSFNLDGTVQNYQEEKPYLDIKASGGLNQGVFEVFFKDWGIAELKFDKEVDFRVAIQGRRGLDLSIKSFVDATRTNLLYSSWIKKDEGYPLTVEASLRIKGKGMDMDKVTVRFGASSIDIAGHIPYQRGQGVKGSREDNHLNQPLTIKTTNLKIDDLDGMVPFLRTEFPSKGLISAQLKIKWGRKTSIDGEARVQAGEFETNILPKKVSNVDLVARISGNSGSLIVKDMWVGSSNISGRIESP
ncbi:MAG: hypothetical protein HY878_03395, partial [Deltaproteobacteria bacterium]|nr:hypothetical protein [Deltaproteobacteria bacterium]